jgi:hypothetical protein
LPNIWEDTDVSRIAVWDGGQPNLNLGLLDDDERSMIMMFIQADSEVGPDSSARANIGACVAGVRSFEGLSELPTGDRLTGWRKFVLYNTGCNVQLLWEYHKQEATGEVGIFGDWVVATIGKNGWGPDGNQSALGSVHSNCMAVAAQAGGGVRQNSVTGRFEAPTGDEARKYVPVEGMASVRPVSASPPALAAQPQKRGLVRRR